MPEPTHPRRWKRPWCRLFGSLLALSSLAAGSLNAGVAGNIAVYPTNSSIEIDHLKIYKVPGRQFTAYVPISPNTIQWMVNGIVGGNTTFGTISATGLYVPPKTVPVRNVVTVSAQSKAYPSSIGSTSLKITRSVPNLWSVSPSPLQSGNYSVTFNGSNFAPDSVATANGIDVATTFVSPTTLVAKGFAPAGTMKFQVRQPGPGAVTSSQVLVTVTASTVKVTVAPAAATVPLRGSQSFTSTVTGNSNTAVTWSVNGVAGGSSSVGTVSMSGVYTAPENLPVPATVTIKAASMANPAASAQATVSLVTPPPPTVTVTVAPATVSVPYGGTRTFTATVANATNTAVTWYVNGAQGAGPSQ